MDDFLKPDICSACGGKCCKAIPGCYMPDDFADPKKDSIKAAIDSGKVAIDCWEGDPTGGKREFAYFLRPPTIEISNLLDKSWGAACKFVDTSGCTLPIDDKPTGCKLLEPHIGQGTCQSHGGSMRDASIAWLPYTDLIDSFIYPS